MSCERLRVLGGRLNFDYGLHEYYDDYDRI